MTKIRIALLASCGFVSFFHQPNWVSDNFWYEAEFWDYLPFNFPYIGFILIYTVLTTILFDQFIRFVKKYA